MTRFRSFRGSGPWDFARQWDKFGYINNPRWAKEPAHENDHLPCGYWYMGQMVPYILPDILPIWEPSSMSFDPETRKLYTTCVRNYVGTKNLRKVFETDIDSFQHTKVWGSSAIGSHDLVLIGPEANPPYFRDELVQSHVWWNSDHGDRYLIPVSIRSGMLIDLLNARNNTITSYDLDHVAGNVGRDPDCVSEMAGVPFRPRLILTRVNYEQQRLYVVLTRTFYYRRIIEIGYISIGSGNYTRLLCERNTLSERNLMGCEWGQTPFSVYPEYNRMLLTGLSPAANHPAQFGGHLCIWDLSGNEIRKFTYSNNPQFPYFGVSNAVWHPNGYIYGGIRYDGVRQPTYRGLCRIHPSSGEVTFHRPAYAPDLTNYDFRDLHVGSDGLIYANHYGHGIAVFDPGA